VEPHAVLLSDGAHLLTSTVVWTAGVKANPLLAEFGFPIKGFLGWWITRTYHLYQLPLLSRKLRVVTDWTVALFFRRDIAELGVLEHPRRLGD
jgi:NADH dehydrogenase FAD-containing subunit